MSSTFPGSLINDWYNFAKTIDKQVVVTHSARQRFDTDDDDSSSVYSLKRHHVDDAAYPRVYQEEEERMALQGGGTSVCASNVGGCSSRMDKVEELSSCLGNYTQLSDRLNQEAADDYKRFASMPSRGSTNLVIESYRDQIIEMVEFNRVTIIQGTTGSGKTTQVPQYILDHAMSQERHCNIVVTQPRRIAAMSVCKRVQTERNWSPVDGLAGYQVGLDKKASEKTRLLFVTTGVLLQKLVAAKHLNDYTHIILDEVHERDQDMDFLLLVVRKLSRTVSKHTKIILMSATMDVDLLANYFTIPLGDVMIPAQVLYIEGKTYPVYDFWIDQIAMLGPLPEFDYTEPKLSPQAITLAFRLIVKFDEIEKSEQEVVAGREFAPERGSILCFLPGIEEINEMHRPLVADNNATSRKWIIIPLHSMITMEEQQKVFDRPAVGYRKIILATNIAESSITVPDVKFVIDFCLTKSLVCDPTTNYTALLLEWASRANCVQRRGRAGRVSKGRAYRMVPQDFYEHQLREFSIPEMRRCPLDKVILHAKMLDMGSPKAILGLAIDPPDLADIERTILTLFEVFALTLKMDENGFVDPQDGELTSFGRILARLPVDVHLGKLMLLGHALGCLEECIIIAAGLSQRNIFARPFNEPLLAYRNKMSWTRQSMSDCIAVVNVYKKFIAHLNQRKFVRPGVRAAEKRWGEKNFVQPSRLHDVKKLVEDLTQRLAKMNILVPRHTRLLERQEEIDNENLLKFVIAGAFYPNYFTHSDVDEMTISRELGEFPLEHTVVLSGFHPGHGILYKNKIENLLQEKQLTNTIPTLDFDHSKVYVRFRQSDMCFPHVDDERGELKRERVAPEVYCSVKARNLRIPFEINVLPEAEAERRVQILNEGKQLRSTRFSSSDYTQQLKQVALPNVNQSTFEFFVTHILDCGHFWAIYSDQDHLQFGRYIRDMIKRQIMGKEMGNRISVSETLKPDMLCLAPFVDDSGATEYYRARIESVSGGGEIVEIFFVDFGNKDTVTRSQLRHIDATTFPDLLNIPMQAFECVICCVKPSPVRCPGGSWSQDAKRLFSRILRDVSNIGRVYSVVHNVIHVEIILRGPGNCERSLNDILMSEGFAIEAEEAYLSKQNNALRGRAHHSAVMEEEEDRATPTTHSDMSMFENLELPVRGCHKQRLRGPSSPAEKSFIGLTRACTLLAVRVDQDSVNSVLFHEKPQEKHKRLLVASSVSVNPMVTSITARNTTMMPDFAGLLELLAIIFSPRVEFRTDVKRTVYIGAICGLGYNVLTNQSIFTDHDMEISFDTKITPEDIAKVNKIRAMLNLLLGSEDEMCGETSEHFNSLQKLLREELKRLLFQNREKVDNPAVCLRQYQWGVIDPTLLLSPEMDRDGTEADKFQLLPLLSAVELWTDMYEHVEHLYSMASHSTDYDPIHCMLCSMTVSCPRDLMLHLKSQKHLDKEGQHFCKS